MENTKIIGNRFVYLRRQNFINNILWNFCNSLPNSNKPNMHMLNVFYCFFFLLAYINGCVKICVHFLNFISKEEKIMKIIHVSFLLGKFETILIQQKIINGSAKILCSANYCPINHVEQ